MDKLQLTVPHNLAILAHSFVPSDASMELFSLTPTFVPTPVFNPHRQILRQVEDFIRKLQWRMSISFSNEPPRFGYYKTGAWIPERLLPHHVRQLSQRLFHGVRSLLDNDHSCHFESNVNCAPNQVLEDIRSQGCTVTTADKGGRWTIVPTTAYRQEALRQLHDDTFYARHDEENRTINVAQRILVLLRQLKQRHFITPREFKFLCPPEQPQERSFKLLPKLHKSQWFDPTMPPGRPIVADTGSISRNAGEIVEHFLYPLCTLLPSHLKDTRHFIAILRTTQLPLNCTLFTLDVESLYTNVPIQEGISAVASMFLEHPDERRPDLTLLTLLRLILTSNTFRFEDTRWLQLHGVAMGQVFGGSFANIFLGRWERDALSTAAHRPLLWVRFQDDIFGVWQHDQASLQSFVTHLNAQHPKIKLKLTTGESVDFLDLTVKIQGTYISHQPFFKETDSHLVLPPTSHHPSSTFRGLLYSETLRFSVNSSSRAAFEGAFATVSPVWRKQGYTRTAIRAAKKDVLTHTGQHLTWETGMFPCGRPSCSTCVRVNATTTIRDPNSQLIYPITSRLSCESRGTLYAIECAACGARYVGETSQMLRARITQHLAAIRSGDSTALVHRHFRTNCAVEHFKFYAFAAHQHDKARKSKEALWIARLKTISPRGLNTKRSDLPQPTALVLPYCACAARVKAAMTSWCGHETSRVTFIKTRCLREQSTAATVHTVSSDRHSSPPR